MRVPCLVGAIVVALSPAALAQGGSITTETVFIGNPAAGGCQSIGNVPTLSGGTPAAARVDIRYNSGSQVLRLDVTNQSPVFPGIPNPVLTKIALNLPMGAVTTGSLKAQAGTLGAPRASGSTSTPTASW